MRCQVLYLLLFLTLALAIYVLETRTSKREEIKHRKTLTAMEQNAKIQKVKWEYRARRIFKK